MQQQINLDKIVSLCYNICTITKGVKNMENEVIERIQQVKNTCKYLDKKLHELHEKNDKEGASAYVLDEIREDIIKINEVYRDVNSLTLEQNEVAISVIEEDLIKKYGYEALGKVKPEVVEVEKKTYGGYIPGVITGVLVTGLVGGSVAYSLFNQYNKNIDNSNEATVEEENDSSTLTNEYGELIKVDSMELKPGEYGTFFNVEDDEQVNARAEYIYNNYLSKFMDKLCDADRKVIIKDHETVEDAIREIANTIRVVNGKLPVDENGNRNLDASVDSVEDYYLNRLIDYTANIPSCDVMETIEYVPGYLFAEDGSELSEFIKSYDDIYRKIAEARNNRNGENLAKYVKVMAAKYWTEWFLQGMYGNILYDAECKEIYYGDTIPEGVEGYVVRNPYALKDHLKANAFYATMFRYGSFIYEAEHNQMSTQCIPSCIDYSSKEIDYLSIDQIYTAIDSGVWNNIIAKSAGMEAPKDPVSVGFWQALNKELYFEYNNMKSLQLK